ncbi:MAG TPA: ATP-binding protein [Blastocatellia bacterium]|nr:ATP-binding protein [Blastocatellia bacterium]
MAKILIVDDIAANREVASTVLSYAGHEMLAAADGEDGLAIIRDQHPDLVITDILMPTMDGFEFARRVRQDPGISETSIIFYTAAYLEHEIRQLAADCGVHHILAKPVDVQAMLEMVNAVLGLDNQLPKPLRLDDFDRDHLRVMTDKLTQKVSELESVTHRLESLLALAQEVASETDPDSLLQSICWAARSAMAARFSAICLIDEPGQLIRFPYVAGTDGRPLSPLSIAGPSIPGDPAVTCRVSGARIDAASFGLPPEFPPLSSGLRASMNTRTASYGSIFVANRVGGNEFSEQDERMLLTLATQTAIAYENLLRFQRIEQHASELEEAVRARTVELTRSNSDLEQFAYAASHDLQEPLRKVIGYTKLLEKRYRGKLDDEADKFIWYAVDGAARMQILIHDLLAYSRVGKGKELAPVDVQGAVDRAVDNLQTAIEEAGAKVQISTPLPTVDADAGQLVQLFQNLIGNAVKFKGDRDPVVTLSARLMDDGGRGNGPAEWLFSISDNGIGIEPEFQASIFGIFQRLHGRDKYPGTGIGLALCNRIVTRHGGSLWVESQPGEGSTFYFTIPGHRHCAQPDTDK